MKSHLIYIFAALVLTCHLIDEVHPKSVSNNYQKELDISCFVHIGDGGRPVVDCKMNKVSRGSMSDLKMNVKSTLTEQGGMQSLNIALYNMKVVEQEGWSQSISRQDEQQEKAKPPNGYEHINGLGYYKFYSDMVMKYTEAESRCIKDGGHLLVVNSRSEAMAMKYFFGKYPQTDIYAFIGFHDMRNTGTFRTVQGQTLSDAGYASWSPGEPNNKNGREKCGSLDNKGLLNDLPCDNSHCRNFNDCRARPFICEFQI